VDGRPIDELVLGHQFYLVIAGIPVELKRIAAAFDDL
jgi:hypothetical protein